MLGLHSYMPLSDESNFYKVSCLLWFTRTTTNSLWKIIIQVNRDRDICYPASDTRKSRRTVLMSKNTKSLDVLLYLRGVLWRGQRLSQNVRNAAAWGVFSDLSGLVHGGWTADVAQHSTSMWSRWGRQRHLLLHTVPLSQWEIHQLKLARKKTTK